MSAAPVRPGNSGTEPPSAKRDALDRILRSEFLNRAPNLVLFLRYVCEKQLAGHPEAIKEYNIAVEALGRGPEFDQKRDSIVRVEAHRLRKRLSEYYETSGSNDPMEIVLPPGSYVPVFRVRGGTSGPETVQDTVDVHPDQAPATVPPVSSKGGRPTWFILLGAALLIALSSVLWLRNRGTPPINRVTEEAAKVPVLTPPGTPMRIAVAALRDGGGRWQKDDFFVGGEVVTATPRRIWRTPDESLYLTRRQGDFEYRFPVPPGSYELRLHFAETVFGDENVAGGAESSRVFEVQVNDGAIWTVDIISEAAGANTANIRVYRNVHPAADGKIHVRFRPGRKEAAFVNGIEVIPAPSGRSLPVRVLARPLALALPSGEEWEADQYWLGGNTVQRHEKPDGAEASELYEGERYGNFSYAIPVATDTRYTLTLRFAETWFGEGRPGGGGAGSRIFNVYCNGKTLLHNLDVLKEAGGPMRQLKKVFRNLEPNAQGKLNLQFVPVRNYAMVNAIEVIDEAR